MFVEKIKNFSCKRSSWEEESSGEKCAEKGYGKRRARALEIRLGRSASLGVLPTAPFLHGNKGRDAVRPITNASILKIHDKNACKNFRFGLYYICCDRWGVSGALNLQSAIAEPNAFLGAVYGRLRAVRGVDNKVLCNVCPRTVSG